MTDMTDQRIINLWYSTLKLEKFVVERRTKLLKDSGIKFVQNFEVGKDKTLNQLRELHDSILIATGVYKPKEIKSLVRI